MSEELIKNLCECVAELRKQQNDFERDKCEKTILKVKEVIPNEVNSFEAGKAIAGRLYYNNWQDI